jgi:hypothetical protein
MDSKVSWAIVANLFQVWRLGNFTIECQSKSLDILSPSNYQVKEYVKYIWYVEKIII